MEFLSLSSDAVVTDQPIDDVPSLIRIGNVINSNIAIKYTNSLEFNKNNYQGCYYIRCGKTVNSCPCGYSYNYYFGECLCSQICFLFCIPLPPCCCTCERQNNIYITRDRRGIKNGVIVLVDEEKGTLAHYSVCCNKIATEPYCMSTRIQSDRI